MTLVDALAVNMIPIRLSGLIAAIPAASSANGARFYATDDDVVKFSTGAEWVTTDLCEANEAAGYTSGDLADRPTAATMVGWLYQDEDGIVYEAFPGGWATISTPKSDTTSTAEIENSAITAAKLANAVADAIPTTTVAVANTGTPDGVANITGQVKDAQGNALTGRFIITLWLATSAAWAAPADLGTLTAKTNSLLLKEDTDNAFARILTNSDGSWGAELDTTEDGTIHAHATVSFAAATANAAITGNA